MFFSKGLGSGVSEVLGPGPDSLSKDSSLTLQYILSGWNIK